MKKLLAILIVGGLAVSTAMAAPPKHRGSHGKGHRSKTLRAKAQSVKRGNKARTIPKNRRLA
jgi:hypothetical protein